MIIFAVRVKCMHPVRHVTQFFFFCVQSSVYYTFFMLQLIRSSIVNSYKNADMIKTTINAKRNICKVQDAINLGKMNN